MAGFRMGRGRDPRDAQQQHGQYPPQQAPGTYGQPVHGQPPYGRGQQPPPGRSGQTLWRQGGGRHGEPEYFGDPGHGQPGHGRPGPGGHPGPVRPAGHDPANNPGHTQMFSFGEAPDHGRPPHQGDGYTDGAAYGAGQPPAPPAGPRLPWKQLLSGIVLRPNATFWQMRDHTVWGPALVVTFLYGLLAVFGFGQAREDAINSTLSSAIPYVLITGVAVVVSALLMGVVTHTLARQLGGDGLWGPTVGLSMLIMSLTDAPRLVLAMFLGGEASVVQVVGWATWIAAGALLTSMVGRSHDLPWPKALGASSIQLIALLALFKLGTL